ncbi:hypothetical protein [Mesorhizobium sp. WSM2239]|uniref:Uncharacterized protein n=2 Tax=unclassified Mesorhizobium TaxID=325217 RepID=A0AAU8D9Z0_9HYPH
MCGAGLSEGLLSRCDFIATDIRRHLNLAPKGWVEIRAFVVACSISSGWRSAGGVCGVFGLNENVCPVDSVLLNKMLDHTVSRFPRPECPTDGLYIIVIHAVTFHIGRRNRWELKSFRPAYSYEWQGTLPSGRNTRLLPES